jgi:hypothetical protein
MVLMLRLQAGKLLERMRAVKFLSQVLTDYVICCRIGPVLLSFHESREV